jgi:hypothetical protein
VIQASATLKTASDSHDGPASIALMKLLNAVSIITDSDDTTAFIDCCKLDITELTQVFRPFIAELIDDDRELIDELMKDDRLLIAEVNHDHRLLITELNDDDKELIDDAMYL